MILFFIILGVGVTLDLVSKALTMGMAEKTVINGVLKLVYAENKGASTGIFSNIPGAVYWLAIFCMVVLLGFSMLYYKSKVLQRSKFFGIGAGLFIAGAIGNMIDRLFFGFVRDFISIEFVNFWPFNTVFNLADVFVCIGVILLIIYILFCYERGKKKYANKG